MGNEHQGNKLIWYNRVLHRYLRPFKRYKESFQVVTLSGGGKYLIADKGKYKIFCRVGLCLVFPKALRKFFKEDIEPVILLILSEKRSVFNKVNCLECRHRKYVLESNRYMIMEVSIKDKTIYK